MKSTLLSRLALAGSLAGTLAFAGVAAANAETAKPKPVNTINHTIDRTVTGSIQTPDALAGVTVCEGKERIADCAADHRGSRYPVNALEGLHLGM
jgi:hypothetical protein